MSQPQRRYGRQDRCETHRLATAAALTAPCSAQLSQLSAQLYGPHSADVGGCGPGFARNVGETREQCQANTTVANKQNKQPCNTLLSQNWPECAQAPSQP